MLIINQGTWWKVFVVHDDSWMIQESESTNSDEDDVVVMHDIFTYTKSFEGVIDILGPTRLINELRKESIGDLAYLYDAAATALERGNIAEAEEALLEVANSCWLDPVEGNVRGTPTTGQRRHAFGQPSSVQLNFIRARLNLVQRFFAQIGRVTMAPRKIAPTSRGARRLALLAADAEQAPGREAAGPEEHHRAMLRRP